MARSTAEGRAAIAVIRLSGPDAVVITARCFDPATSLAGAQGHALTHGRVLGGGGAVIDDVVAATYRAPRSYTGEDVVELSCHGNPLIVKEILERLTECGARPATHGEFTRRAFLNGKIDLAQAEAVCRLIEARSSAGARGAIAQLAGGLSTRVTTLRRAVLETLARIEAHVDFPDEALGDLDRRELAGRIAAHAGAASRLHAGARRARATTGVTSIAILGAPNAGKSSLFNALVGRDRSIVHDEPGTTRDIVDAEVTLGALAVRLTDTAGLREDAAGLREPGQAVDVPGACPTGPRDGPSGTSDGDRAETTGAAEREGIRAVELEGIRRSREAAAVADRLLVVLDGSRKGISVAEHTLLGTSDRARTIVVVSKSDLPRRLPASACEGWEPILVSAVTGEGLAALEETIVRAITEGASPVDRESTDAGTIVDDEGDLGEAMAGGERVEGAFGDAAAALHRAIGALEDAGALELVAEELRQAANALGGVTGARAAPEILDVIFSRFCIGK